MSDRDRGNLLAVLDSIEKISKYVEGIRDGEELSANTMAFDAVLMNFVNIGELALRISDDLKDASKSIPWKEIVGLRNIIAHDDLIPFAERVRKLLKP